MSTTPVKSRTEMRRLDQEHNKKYRGFLGFSIFILVSVIFMMATFLSPSVVKREITKESNIGAINRTVNNGFNVFSNDIGADRESDRNLLTSKQTIPIANEVVDFTLGIHWFKTDAKELSKKIEHILTTKIDDDSSNEALRIKRLINKSQRTAVYAIDSGFNISGILFLANAATLGLIIGTIVVILSVMMIVSIIKKLMVYYNPRAIIHNFFGSSMWAGGFIILFFGMVSLIPSLVNVEQVFGWGFGLFLEVGTGKFLELVIIGVALFVISIIPWAASKNN